MHVSMSREYPTAYQTDLTIGITVAVIAGAGMGL